MSGTEKLRNIKTKKRRKEGKEVSAIETHEEVLVVDRGILFPDGAHQGILTGVKSVLETILKHGHFKPRSEVEKDPSFKQIIPYMVFVHKDRIFMMSRKGKEDGQTDPRLANLYSLGIGGHVRKEELSGTDIFAWARREFEEEVGYDGDFEIEIVGLINDESNEVGSVHTGLVLILRGNSPNIRVVDEMKDGVLATLGECEKCYTGMESWSKIIFETLKKQWPK